VILIVLAHPDPRSYSAGLARSLEAALVDRGVEVEVLDLYRLPDGPFPPLLDAEELRRHTSFDPLIQGHMDRLETAQGYVVVHPDWWGGPPAILKGWIDRVLRPGTAYDRVDASGAGEAAGLLDGRRALVAVAGDAADPGPLEEFWVERIWAFCGVEARLLYSGPDRRDFESRIVSAARELFAPRRS